MERPVELLLRDYVGYLRDLGIFDLYARATPQTTLPAEAREKLLAAAAKVAPRTPAQAIKLPSAAQSSATPAATVARPVVLTPVASTVSLGDEDHVALPPELTAPMPRPKPFEDYAPPAAERLTVTDKAAALEAIRADIGDCTRCPLAYAGRHTIVFGDGNPNADLMFIGEGPGADEDATGTPFVGKAGQLLNNMITAMGLRREDVYIANIVKCRPPGNRAPEYTEASTCTQFLVRQMDVVQPKVVVALGKTAASYVRGNTDSLASQRGQWFSTRGSKLLVTFHPAFLLRDPRQKAEAWKDLQMVMKELGLKAPAKA
jgi:uracil-DNA glycosylase family 4